MGILTLLLCASGLGLPMLMDPARCSIYYVYLLILTLTVLMDGILYLIFMRRLFTIKTWTIVSANDETQMGLDHGWHYETITFLRNMEYMNKDTKGKMDSDVPDVLLGTGI